MDWLNYHHLFYFWRVARLGSITAAARELRLSHSTLSTQIRDLGELFGGPLFERSGRGLVLTPLGEETVAYADEIFRLGAELRDVAQGSARAAASPPVRIGASPMFPPSLVFQLIEPALRRMKGTPIVLRRESSEALLAELAAGRLHLVLTDAVPTEARRARTYAHVLGRTEIAIFGAADVVAALPGRFPENLDGAPMLLPAIGTTLRRVVDRWLSERAIRPRIVGEFDDAGMLRLCGGRGLGVFPARMTLRSEVEGTFGVRKMGKLAGAEEVYYAVSLERRVRHRFVAALIEAGRTRL